MKRIKVVYIIGSLAAGGAETQLLELLRNLDHARVEPHLALLDHTQADRAMGFVESVYDLQISPRGVHSISRLNLKRGVTGVLRLARHLRNIRPQIVQAILPESNALAAAALMLVRTPILIGSRRSLAGAYRTSKSLTLIDRMATRRSTAMLANSDAVLRELVEVDGVPSHRAFRIYNGIDTQKFRPGNREARSRYGWSDGHVVFGMVANFIRYKRHIDFVAAAERIAGSNGNARFVLAGRDSGGILDSLKREIRNRGMEHLFTILEAVTEPELLYPLLDVYLCTSETEGLSNVLLEAGSCSLPAIATRVGGNPEVIVDGETGILTEPHRPHRVAEAALQLAASPSIRREMGRRSRLRIGSRFSTRAMADAHMALYEGLLNPVRRASLVPWEDVKAG